MNNHNLYMNSQVSSLFPFKPKKKKKQFNPWIKYVLGGLSTNKVFLLENTGLTSVNYSRTLLAL